MTLSPRLAAQIAIGLAADIDALRTSPALLKAAKAAGLTGAEIDAAAQGSSFDVRDAAAVALGCAHRDGSRTDIARNRRKAIQAGLSEADADEVRRLALEHVSRANR